ncbi:GNAT family N-acetyltransferase [Streptomyces sp. NBC_01221]|uniref:bifunctional acetate--CoA ligase family protein/GNAT family N-acetyltransferase n=1 Tax=unclassified Streptomyces TaxID=2593676 RepID=UPI00225B338F|nr:MULTISPECIES: bifunctional GNAT family N-acetyltransferase/acetate--CoA ligase family protein [unclassified Streptomyces]MCX4784966.1 GNAT family N-acetyltransferase [Streptomyces sp. NBC_01221]WSJ40279.1 GNAT family N-acetyltransferase [Streptomyces sp. NBC_01321]
MTSGVPATPEVSALLADGSTVRLRPARPDDHARVLRLYDNMSVANLRSRFFGVSRLSGAQAADRLCVAPTAGHRTLVAVFADRLVGVAEYETADNPASAEFAMAVADDFHHRGVGTLLLEHLVHAARADGVTAFTADALTDNRLVLKVFADLGLCVTRHFDGGTVHCVIGLAPDERYLSAVDSRDRSADTASLRPLLRPRSVAVIGAGTRPGSVGRAILRNLRDARFPGLLYAVNPHAHAVLRIPAFASIGALPHPPDLAVLAVPAAAVPETAAQCGRAGVGALVVVTSGLGARRTAELTTACRHWGMRLVGPNCLGIANTEESVHLDATFAVRRPTPGTAGIAVQSGGVGIALLDGLSRLGIGISSFVSLGDKRDVSSNDLLRWWECDGRTDLALLHLESFGNPRVFSRTARRVARRMPLLTVDAGRSAAGRRAAASHTAAAATPTITRRALFTQAGVTATRTLGELLDTAALLHTQPLPADGRIAVLSNAGGTGVLTADACVDAGLTVPELPVDLAGALLAMLPDGAGTANPVDTTPAVSAPVLSECVERLARSGAVDAVLVVLVPTALATAVGDELSSALTDPVPHHRPNCPVVAVLLDQAERVRLLPTTDGHAVPAYGEPQSAARALSYAVERAHWLAKPHGNMPRPTGVDTCGARALVDACLARTPEGGWLDARQTGELLGHYAIPQLPQACAATEQEAVDAAVRLAGPDGGVALKAQWPGLVHKSEQGAVLLDLYGGERVRAAHRDLSARLGEVMTGVLVQPMAPRGTELLAGVVQDEVFGALVLFGLGGTTSELLADHAARLAPLTDTDVHELITAPRCAPLLSGYRGGGPVDLAGLEDLLARLSLMADDLPELAEAECNPVVARPDGITVVDARIRLLPRRAWDPYLRRLP